MGNSGVIKWARSALIWFWKLCIVYGMKQNYWMTGRFCGWKMERVLRSTTNRRRRQRSLEDEDKEKEKEKVRAEANKRIRPSAVLLHHLPSEILLLVLSFLDCKTLCRVAQISHRFRGLAEKNQLWMDLYSQHFHESSESSAIGPVWKALYRSKHNWKRGNYVARLITTHKSEITALHACTDFLACGLNNGTVELRKRIFLSSPPITLSLHTSTIKCIHISKHVLVTTCSSGRLITWKTHDGEILHHLRHSGPEISCMQALFTDSHTLVTCQTGLIMLWNLKDGTCIRSINGSDDPILYVNPVLIARNTVSIRFAQHIINSFTTSSLSLHSVSFRGLKIGYDFSDKESLPPAQSQYTETPSNIDGADERPTKKTSSVNVFTVSSNGKISSAQFSPNMVIIGSQNNTISVWDESSGWAAKTLFGHTGAIVSVRFDHDKVISASRDHSLRVWDRHTLDLLYVIQVHTSPITATTFEGAQLYSGDETGNLFCIDFGTSEVTRKYQNDFATNADKNTHQ